MIEQLKHDISVNLYAAKEMYIWTKVTEISLFTVKACSKIKEDNFVV